MEDFKKFINQYKGAIIGIIIAIVLLATRLYDVIIGILLILAGISIQGGGSIIKRADLENLKTDMLLIKVKGKEYVSDEEINERLSR